jgi:thiol-disulfide isomerase/thioredoxin
MYTSRMLCAIALALCLGAPSHARDAAPDFTARALSGETFTKSSVRGSVVLVQFWTTWCPVCREDQPSVDAVRSEFAGQGLVVLAVDVHEPEDKVRQYLAERPRLCPIVLTKDTDLVAKYNPHSFPEYIVLDRDGNVAGTQSGAGGETSLRHLLGRAGLTRDGGTEFADKGAGNSPHGQTVAGGKMIVLSGARPAPTATAAPQAATVFVMSSGERLETHQFVLTSESVSVTVDGLKRSIPMSELDVKATVAANHERGIELKMPSRHEVFLGR